MRKDIQATAKNFTYEVNINGFIHPELPYNNAKRLFPKLWRDILLMATMHPNAVGVEIVIKGNLYRVQANPIH